MKIACTLIKLVDRIEFHFETDWNDLKIVPALTHRNFFLVKFINLHNYMYIDVIKQWFEERSTSGFFFLYLPENSKSV